MVVWERLVCKVYNGLLFVIIHKKQIRNTMQFLNSINNTKRNSCHWLLLLFPPIPSVYA